MIPIMQFQRLCVLLLGKQCSHYTIGYCYVDLRYIWSCMKKRLDLPLQSMLLPPFLYCDHESSPVSVTVAMVGYEHNKVIHTSAMKSTTKSR